MRRWAGAISAAVTLATIILITQVLPWRTSALGDFPPFVMTIEEWNADRGRTVDGATITGTYVYRVEYHDRSNWTRSLTADIAPGAPTRLILGQGNACRAGTYGQVDIHGVFHATSTDPLMCTSLDRWIHYGIAWSYPWAKQVGDGTITYTDPGERVVFDPSTGLPLVYEAGLTTGNATYRVTYRVESWGR